MLLSLFVYGSTALILFLLAQNIVATDDLVFRMAGRHPKMLSSALVMSIIVFAMVAGARYNTGVDHLRYLAGYETISKMGGDIEGEIGFYSISLVLSSLGFHYFFFFALWAAMQFTFVYFAFKGRRELLPYVALVIMLGPYFLDWMNGIRQSIVVCFFFFLISSQQWTKKSLKNYVFYLLLILSATTFHRSAFLLIPLFILVQFNNPIMNKWINIVIVIVCVYLGLTPEWISMTTRATDALLFMGYDSYADHYEDLIDFEQFSETAFGPLRLSTLAVDIIIIWFYPKIKEYYSEDYCLNAFFILFFCGVCAYNLFANTNMLFLRPISYLTIFKLPLVAYLLYYLRKTRIYLFLIVAILEYSYTFIEVLKSGLTGSREYNLYHFFFLYDALT